uniref:NACHT domain-containing protein n=1 Tax=Strigamia maritima TaxID=126957 RepID=T1J3Q8_STRMM
MNGRKAKFFMVIVVDTLIVFSNSEWDYDRALNFVKNYRISLNANLLYVFVELSSNTKRTIFNDSYTGHPNNILLSGFSDQLLRFIAERGSSRQLREINQIDVKYKLKCSRAVKKTNKNLLSTPYIAVPRWRTARVFISSTFRDMHGERDLLLRSVFPQLRARALDLCVDVHDIDLRWGITEQEAEDNKMVEICLSEAAECDVFVGLLGSRYGTIVNPEQIPESERFDWARAYPEGSSITELEFEIGALSRKDFAEERAVVCIRDNSFLDDVSSDYANDLLPENDEHRIKLEELKCRVRSANFQLIDNYACKWNGGVDNIAAVSGLEDLGELIVDRLWVALKFLYSDDIKLDDSIHENFAAQQSKCFTGRNNVLAQCMTAVNKKKDLIIVNGKSGNGKTALMSKLCVELMRNERNVVIPYFADAISGAETTDDVIAYFCRKLGSNIKSQVTDSCKTTVIHEMLHSAIEYSARFLLLLDGVEELAWIPNPVPPNVQFICTLTENSSLNTREMLRIPLPPLDLKERAEFVRAILLPHRKKLSESLLDNQLNKFITKHEAYSPLFLTFACHQMRLFWVFKEISENVRKMPNSVSGLLKEIMLQIERNNGSTLVSTAFKLLLMSKGGLLEEELYSILNLWMCSRKFNDPDLIEMCRLGNYKLLSRSRFAKFYGSVKVFLNLSSTLRNDALKISHREIVSVISKYCNPLENDLELNKCIAVYYLRQIDPTENENWLGRNPKAFEFVIARLISSGNLGKAVTLMTDLKFLFAKSNIGLCQSILEDFVLIQKEMNRSGSCESKLNDYQRFINRHRRSLNDVPSRIFQLAMNETNSIVSSDAKIHENIPPMIEWLNKSDQSDCCTAVFTLNQAVNCVSTYAGVAAAGIINGTIQLIDLTTSKVIRNIAAHCAEITCICFVDANLLICASESTLSSWNIDTGNRVVTFNGHERKVTAIGRGSGRTIICSVSWDRSIKIWDLKSGRNLSTCCEQYPISCCVMHPTRNDIAVGLWDGSVRIWNLISLKRTAILHGHKTSVSSISLSTCGKYLASSSLDGEIILRSSRHGFQLSKFRASDMRVNDIVFNGKDLWSVADDCAVKVWSSLLNDTREVSFPPPTASKVLYIATNPLNTAEVVVAYEDSTIIKLNSQSGDVLFTVRPILSRVCCVYFDKFIYVAYLSDDLQVLGSETGEIVKCFRTDRVNAITAICCFANDSPIFGYADGTVVVYWYESECRQFKAHDDVITCVVVHPDKHKLFATVSRDKSLKVWRVEEELVAVVDNCHADWINCCVWAPRNGDDFLVTSSNDNSVKLWSLTGSLLTLALVLGHTTGPAIFVDIWENCVICGASDGNIKMFTLKGSEVLSVDGQTTTHFVSCLNKNARTITNWYEEVMNVETEERTESDKSWPSGSLMSISNGTIKDSHLFGTNKVAILSGHSSSVQTAFVMADETVVTGSADGSLMKWNKGTNYQCQENRSEVCSIAWDKSGEDELMVSCCRDGLVSLWKNDKFSDKIIRISNFKLNSECVNGIHLIRKDKFLVTCDDGLICLCKIDDNFTVNLHETRELKRPICCSVYCDEEDILAVATIDGRVCINDVKSGKSRRVFEVSRSNWVIDMKFEDKKLVMLDTSGELKIVSVDADEKDSKLVNVAELELELDCNVIPHCFILESDFYFIGLSDGLLTRIEGDKKTDVRIHDGGVKFCVIDDTKRFLVTASNDRIVKVWNFDSTVGSEVAQFECSAPICALSVPSINLIVCGDFHGKIYFLRLLQST